MGWLFKISDTRLYQNARSVTLNNPPPPPPPPERTYIDKMNKP